MLGCYHMPNVAPMAAGNDPRMARLRAAFPTWEYRRHPDGGTLIVPKDAGTSLAGCGPAVECHDGLRWHPPIVMPSLHDLARDDMPQPSTRVKLRRCGTISVPLGVGPVYGVGPKRGQPSSTFGRLAFDMFNRTKDADRTWSNEDDNDAERLLMLAIQSGYHLTEELFEEIAPYDQDEAAQILHVIWGNDPKASASDGPTSPPSPRASSRTPG